MLCGADWTACSLMMTLSSDLITCNFSHDNEKVTPAWHGHKVAYWSNYNNVSDAHKRKCEMTYVKWRKCSHYRKQAVEDA